MRYRIEVRGVWAGNSGDWRPAVDGVFNQTGQSADKSSTFDTKEEVDRVLDVVLSPFATGAEQFRIVLVDASVDWSFEGNDRIVLVQATGEAWRLDAGVRLDVREDARTLFRAMRRPIHIVYAGVVLETIPAVTT